MAKRRENLLEAFKASAEAATTGRPDGVSDPAQRPARSPSGPKAPKAPSEGLTLPLGALPLLLLQGTLLVLVFLMGYFAGEDRGVRAQGEGARAPATPGGSFHLAEPGGGASAVLPPRQDPSAPPEEPSQEPVTTEADLAFADPANKVTVLVFSADDTAFGEERVWNNYRHLRELGFPAVTPRRRRGLILLFVGAAPTMGELEDLRTKVSLTPDPDGRVRAFRDAYLENIETYR